MPATKNITWKICPVKISELSLWDENPRFSEEYFKKTEIELVDHFLNKSANKIESLAKEIVSEFDLPQLERLVVWETSGKKVVLEGNRRVTVYKLLINPELAKNNAPAYKLFKELNKQVTIPKGFQLETILTASKDDGLKFIERKHNKGNNEVAWGEPERRRFAVRRSHGNSKDVLRIELANAVKALPLPEVIKEAVLGKGLITTFYRVVDSAPARVKLGYEALADGSLRVKDQVEFDLFLTIMVYQIWSKSDFNGKVVDSRSLNKADAIKEYVSKISSTEAKVVAKKVKEATKHTLFGEPVVLSPSKTVSKRAVADRKYLINSAIIINSTRINDIYIELKNKLEVDVVPNAVAVLFRVFIECSIDCYIETFKVQVKPETKLAGKILLVVDSLEEGIALRRLTEEGNSSPTTADFKKAKDKVKFKVMRQLATKDNGSILAIDTFHNFVHDYKVSPIPTELKKHWENLDSFFISLWTTISSKK